MTWALIVCQLNSPCYPLLTFAGAFCLLFLSTKLSKEAGETFLDRLIAQKAILSPAKWFYGPERAFRLGFGYLSLADLEAGLKLVSKILRETK